MSEPVVTHPDDYLYTLIFEAAPGRFRVDIRWIDNAGADHQGAWRISLDGDNIAEHRDLESCAFDALEEFRTWES